MCNKLIINIIALQGLKEFYEEAYSHGMSVK